MKVTFNFAVKYHGVRFNPGEVIEVEDCEVELLRSQGAKVLATTNTHIKSSPMVETSADKESVEVTPVEDFSKMSKSELLEYATKRNLSVKPTMSKAALVNLIKADM